MATKQVDREKVVWMDEGGMLWIVEEDQGYVVYLDGEKASINVLLFATAKKIAEAYCEDDGFEIDFE